MGKTPSSRARRPAVRYRIHNQAGCLEVVGERTFRPHTPYFCSTSHQKPVLSCHFRVSCVKGSISQCVVSVAMILVGSFVHGQTTEAEEIKGDSLDTLEAIGISDYKTGDVINEENTLRTATVDRETLARYPRSSWKSTG